jgi:hypothetical protein
MNGIPFGFTGGKPKTPPENGKMLDTAIGKVDYQF